MQRLCRIRIGERTGVSGRSPGKQEECYEMLNHFVRKITETNTFVLIRSLINVNAYLRLKCRNAADVQRD